jgi:hypothetical protein
MFPDRKMARQGEPYQEIHFLALPCAGVALFRHSLARELPFFDKVNSLIMQKQVFPTVFRF